MSKANQLEQLNAQSLVGVPILSMNGRILHTPYGEMIDFANINYLGFDYNPEPHERGAKFTREWGNMVSPSRLEADAVIFTELEKRITTWLGAKETIMGHTITVMGFSIMSKLAGKGIMLTDNKLHTVVYEACRLARDHGATIERFKHQDLNDLEDKLKKHAHVSPKIILVDGVYSISSEKAPLREMNALCEKYDAWLYVDDAHGFGMLGRGATKENPYGLGGRGVVDYFGLPMNRIFYVTSFSKAFCTHYAFVSVPTDYKEMLRENCLQYIFSAPLSPYNVGVIHAMLDLNEREGDMRRKFLLNLTRRFTSGLSERGLAFQNDEEFPVIYWKIGSLELLVEVTKAMYKKGAIAGLRAYPVVPHDECGLRFGLTAIHTVEQIEKTLRIIDELCREFPLIKRASAA